MQIARQHCKQHTPGIPSQQQPCAPVFTKMSLLGAGRCLLHGTQPTASCSAPSACRPVIRPRAPRLRAVLPVRSDSAEWLSAELDIGGPDVRRAQLAQSLQLNGELPIGHPDGILMPTERTIHQPADTSTSSPTTTTAATSTSSPTTTTAATAPSTANTHRPAASTATSADAAASSAAGASDALSDEDDTVLHHEFMDCTCLEDVLDVLEDELHSMSARNTVTALKQLQKLSRARRRSEVLSLLGSRTFLGLLARLAAQLPSMSAFQAVNCLHSCAALGAPLKATPALLNRFDEALHRTAPGFNDRDVSSALHAYAQLRYRPSDTVLEPIARRAQQLLDQGSVSAQGVSMILWACGTLGYKHGYLLTALVTWLEGPGFKGLTPQGAANCAWALAKLGRATAAVLDRALGMVGSAEDACKPQEVANVLWACVASRHHPVVGFNSVLQYASRNASRLSAADLANIFHALGTFAHRPSVAVLSALSKRALALLPSMRAAEAVNVYWGLGLSGAAEDAPELFAAIGDRRLPALAAGAGSGARGGSAGASVNSSTAAVAGDAAAELAEGAAATAASPATAAATASGALSAPLLRQAFQGFLAAKLAGAKVTLPRELLELMRAAWSEGLGEPGTRRPLGVHGQLVSALKELGVKHEACTTSKDGLIPVDVLVKGGGGRIIALQVAADHEYTANTQQLLGPALFARDVLEQVCGWDMRYVSSREWMETPAHTRLQSTVALLRAVGVGVSQQAAARAAARLEEGPAAFAQQGRGKKGAAAAADDAAAGSRMLTGRDGVADQQQEQQQRQGRGRQRGSPHVDVKPQELDLLMGGSSSGSSSRGGRHHRAGKGSSSRGGGKKVFPRW